MTRKLPNPVDVHVGARVRMRRMLIGMSQEKLGESLGLTFQQVQKYERGVDRVGAGRLYEVATALQVPVTYFFEELGGGPPVPEDPGPPMPERFEDRPETADLIAAFTAIAEPRIRADLVRLMRTIAAS